mgnify:CR=1 FL=1
MKFSAVLLAAGASLRMRGRHKMLLPAPVEPVVRRSARSVEQSGACEVVVVTGHGHERVAEALAGLQIGRAHV